MKRGMRTRRATHICVPDLTPVDDGSTCRPHHTKSPAGYIAWHEWAERMSRMHSCERCPSCGLWAIWKRKVAS